MKKLTLICVALLTATFVFGQEKDINKTFESVKSIKIKTSAGTCILKKSSGNSVSVNLTHTYDEGKFEPIIELKGTQLVIEEEFNGRTVSGNSKWTLAIPDNIPVSFNTGSGNFSVENLQVSVKSRLGSGDVEFTNVDGDQLITSGSGNVTFSKGTGDIQINTGSGNVSMERMNSTFDINVGSGNIDLDESEGTFAINVGSGNITADDVIVQGSSRFNSGSGNASVYLAAELKADISVNSGSGNAKLDFNNNPIQGEVTMKASKYNGNISAPFEFDTVTEEENGRNTTIKKTVKLGNSDVKIRVSTGSGRAEITK